MKSLLRLLRSSMKKVLVDKIVEREIDIKAEVVEHLEPLGLSLGTRETVARAVYTFLIRAVCDSVDKI